MIQTTIVDLPNPSFRISAKQFFITYPRCDLDVEDVLARLNQLATMKERDIGRYVMATEKHQDEGKHIHVYLKSSRKLNVRNEYYFDLKKRNGRGAFHPNIQSCRSPSKVMKYCMKDGKYITNIDKLISPFDEAIELSKKRKISEAIELLQDKQARTMVLYYDRIVSNLNSIAGMEDDLPRKSFSVFLTNYFLEIWDKTRTLILTGKSGFGKTCFMITLYNHPLLVSHLDNLKRYNSKFHDGIIYDDMSFLHIPRECQIHVVDFEMPRSINVKHTVVHIPPLTTKCITTNRLSGNVVDIYDAAIKRRIQIIEVLKPLQDYEEGDDFKKYLKERNPNRIAFPDEIDLECNDVINLSDMYP